MKEGLEEKGGLGDNLCVHSSRGVTIHFSILAPLSPLLITGFDSPKNGSRRAWFVYEKGRVLRVEGTP